MSNVSESGLGGWPRPTSHFTEEPDEDGAWVPRVSSPLIEIRRDGSLRVAIAAGASDRRWLLTRIETLFLPINAELISRIEAWLAP